MVNFLYHVNNKLLEGKMIKSLEYAAAQSKTL